jgi:hypothetical protein
MALGKRGQRSSENVDGARSHMEVEEHLAETAVTGSVRTK